MIPPLDRAQLDVFHERLVATKAEIERLLSRTSGDDRPVDLDLPIGRLTRIDAIQMRGLAQQNRRQLDVRRQQIEVALAAIEGGTYGACRSCRGAIVLARLEALPEVPFCLDCQEMFERSG